MSPSWIWSDKTTNERVARVGYILKPGSAADFYFHNYRGLKLKTWCGKFLNLAHYFPYDEKLRLLAHSRSFLANQKARNVIVRAENLLNNNYSMSPCWIWSDKITNERVARVGYNLFISSKGEWNNCFSNFSNRVLPPIFISTILQSGKFLNLAHYFPYDVKLRLLAHSRSFLAIKKLEMQ